MKTLILKYSFLLLLCLLFSFWLKFYSPLNLPENIPNTHFRIHGLFLLCSLLTILILQQKRILILVPETSIGRLTIVGAWTCLNAEIFFQLLRQFTIDAATFLERLYYFAEGTIVITAFGTSLAFLVAFQLKTKRADRLILLIILFLVILNFVQHLIQPLSS